MSAPISRDEGRPRAWEWALLALLLVTFAALAFFASPRKSASFDEQYHLSAGYSYLKTGDYRLAITHPPLAGMVAALPLLADETIHLPLEHPAWQAGNRFEFSDVFLWYANENGPDLVERGRVGIILLGVLLVAGVWFWGRRLVGPLGAVLAASLTALDPNLIANSRQITTDMAVTVCLLLTLWLLWLWLERGALWRLLLAGALAGLTMVAKYNGLLVWPVIGGVLLIHPAAHPDATGLRRRLVGLLTLGGAALFVLWAFYRFDFGPATMLGLTLPLPAPFYWNNLWGTLSGILEEGAVKPDFLLGQVSAQGWWYYFPVAFAVKTPLSTLLLAAAGIVAIGIKGGWRRQAALWLPVLVFVALALTGILTIGYRHLLPALPFLYLLAGNAARLLAGWARTLVAATGALLLLWLAGSTLWFFPNHDSYFNEAAGRWPNWSNILVDSNLDWGQDLPALAAVQEQMGIGRVNLAYFGKSAPERYGVEYAPLPGYLRFMNGREVDAYNPVAPEPGWYAVSATSLRLGTLDPATVDLYGYFRDRTPVARAGYSIYLYEVQEVPGARVEPAVITGQPAWQADRASLGGDGRRAQVRRRQSEATLIFPLGQGFAEPAAPDYHPVDTDFSGIFTFVGYYLETPTPRPGEALRLWLYWRRGRAEVPMPAPTRGEALSAFVHMVGADGRTVAQFDGWETSVRGLAPGDILAQRAEIPLPGDLPAGDYSLLAGLYSPQDLQRILPIGSSDSFVGLDPISVIP